MVQQLLGIDWGTSNRRAYLMAGDGRCLARHEDDQGMLAARGNFAASLDALLRTMRIGPGLPVIMSGMVGSAQGWQEVPYLDCGIPLDRLANNLVPVRGHELGRDCLIVPGYCYRGEDGIDVMRGEETQLLGALALGQRDGWMVLPGTHSKWVLLRDGVIVRLASYMTGELFAALAAQGTLAALMADGQEDETAFAAGVEQARRRAPLSNALFRIRASVVAGAMPAARTRSFVSGLLIGTEFVAACDAGSAPPASISIIASDALSVRYARAAALFDIEVRVLDPHKVYCAALTQFFAKASS